MTDLCSLVGDLEHKSRQSSSCDRNTSERNISKKTEIVENESEKDEDSAIKVSKEEYTPFS